MPCYYPITGYRSRSGPDIGRNIWPIVFSYSKGFQDMPVQIPCGQCIGCRLERSRQWAVRCIHEASLYLNNCFITLTYADNPVTLVKRDFVLFMKRLRKKYATDRIKFFHCGEYGENLGRPHHHACLFNFDFPDKSLYRVNKRYRLYTSSSLSDLWGHGFCLIGDVTFDSAAYVARYVIKKVNGDKMIDHYKGLVPEYVTMSRRPGISHDWFVRYKNDIAAIDGVIVNKHKCKSLRYYDKLFDEVDSDNYKRIKAARTIKRSENDARLRIREVCKRSTITNLNRSYEGS
ncbi:MAG TPA: replication initiation protein [Patescibacteria group bacterium]|nr:replication initiation protein [Patescibacteria group bacterium]